MASARFRGGPGLMVGLDKRRRRGMNGFGKFRGGSGQEVEEDEWLRHIQRWPQNNS